MSAEPVHPFVALMRRYCIDYTNSHDQSLYPELFVDDYRVHIGGVVLERDASYGPAVRQLFDAAPGLGLTVHELVLNGDRLCMRFSEHAAMPTRAGGRALACWRGIGLYRWNGERLTENYVEQDFLGRRRQLDRGEPDPLEPPHLDPWTTTRPTPPDPAAEAAARALVERGALHEAATVLVDDDRPETAHPFVVAPDEVTVNDLFSAGRRVAVYVTFRGAYRGGIDQLDPAAVGTPAVLEVAALLRLADDGSVTEVRAVTSRDTVRAALRRRPGSGP
jgi:predicted ester cyclase